MKLITNVNDPKRNAVRRLLKIYDVMKDLYKKAQDEGERRDYKIYIKDIRRFLEHSPAKNLEDLQVYIDDYQAVIDHAKNTKAHLSHSAQA